MKKTIVIITAIVMVLALAGCSKKPAAQVSAPAGGQAAASPGSWSVDNIRPKTFILAHGQAASSQCGEQYHDFAENVARLSGGKWKIEERVAGSLVTDPETLEALMLDTVQFAHSMSAWVSGTITDVAPLTLIGYYAGTDYIAFADQAYDLLDKIYGAYGVKYLGAEYQGNAVIVCTDKQIKQPSDVKGLTFRASGTWISKSVQAWGGAATTIGLPDLATAFDRRTVQGTATGLNIIEQFKIYEVAKYLTMTNIAESFAACLMSMDAWNACNADEKAMITQAGKEFERRAYDIAVKHFKQNTEKVQAAGRNEIYTLTAAEEKAFTDLTRPLYNEMGLSADGKALVEILNRVNK